jgi:hypothetical protein
MSYEKIVSDYIREYRDRGRAEMSFFEIQRSPSAAIRKAALCQRPSGKRHSHQRRIPRALLQQVEGKLQGISRKLAKAEDFAALHRMVELEIGGMRGIGTLTVYDIAHRIGAHFGKSPALVYLHRGTKKGAAILGFRGEKLDPKVMPSAFLKLTPAEIEDCLCIYKDELRGGRSHRNAGCGVARRSRRCVEPNSSGDR